MLKNPYPAPTSEDDKNAFRFQTYLNGDDKSLLMAIRPVKGTAQAAVNNLILHLCNDLRELGITNYHPNADELLCILTERRALTDDQCERLRRTALGVIKEVPEGLRQHSRSARLREATTGRETSSHNSSSEVERRVEPNSKAKSKSKKNSKG